MLRWGLGNRHRISNSGTKEPLREIPRNSSIVTFGGISIIGRLFSITARGWLLSAVETTVAFALSIIFFIVWIVLMVKAYQGVYYKLPVVGDIAEQLSGKP